MLTDVNRRLLGMWMSSDGAEGDLGTVVVSAVAWWSNVVECILEMWMVRDVNSENNT